MDGKDLEQLLDRATAETRRHFDVVAERTDQKIEAIAEALQSLGDALSGRIDTVEEKMEHGFAETQAMIRFSHAELDRRVRTLEQAVSDLLTRVERLESTTH
jgi:cell division protein ZapA (FtsZ GTPase activity inhibitor)